jgi:predicted TIM-barrel fold metal-dependent hydrolase
MSAAQLAELYDDLPIVDAHHHLWDLGGDLTYPWHTSTEHAYMGDNSALRRSYMPPEFRRDSALHNVISTVHIEAECDRRKQVAETAWLTQVAAEHGMPNAIVAHAWIDEANSEDILLAHKRYPLVRGIRTKPIISKGPNDSVRGQPRSMQDPRWRAGLGLLAKHDLS